MWRQQPDYLTRSSPLHHLRGHEVTMKELTQHLPQDQPAVYRIEVEGPIGERLSSWFEDMTVSITSRADGKKISTLVGPVADQAALHGLLSRIYTLGFLVITVTRVE
jgi:hypothetical protein